MTEHQTILVNGGIPVTWDGNKTHCKKCGVAIGFGITKANKRMPFDLTKAKADSPQHESHWSTCPSAKDFRKPSQVSLEVYSCVAFGTDKTGFTREECTLLNRELSKKLQTLKPFTDEWWQCARVFHKNAETVLRGLNV